MVKKSIFEKKKPADLLEKRKESLENKSSEIDEKKVEVLHEKTVDNDITKNSEVTVKRSAKTNLEDRLMFPDSKTSAGQNVRVKSETHGLLKATSLVKEQEMYSIMEEALRDYIQKQSKNTQNEIFKKVRGMIEFGMIKL